MDLPISLYGSAVQEGEIYYFTSDCPVGVANHMHVCVKRHGKILFLSTCSSQTDTAIRLAMVRNWDLNTFPVFMNDTRNKFKKPTYINCNNLVEMTEEDFSEYRAKGYIRKSENDGFIDEQGLAIIAKGIKLSTQIEDETKDLF